MATTFQNVQDRINLDYLNRTDLTNETQRAIIRAINHYQYERFWFNQTATALTCVTTGNTVALPADFIALDMVTVKSSSAGYAAGYIVQQRSMERVTYRNAFGTVSGMPQEVAVYNGALNLWPLPHSAYSLTVRYVNVLPPLSAGTDTNDWLSAAEDLIVFHATADMLQNVIRGRDQEVQEMQAMEAMALQALTRARNIRLNTNEDLSLVGPQQRQNPNKTGNDNDGAALSVLQMPQNPTQMEPGR